MCSNVPDGSKLIFETYNYNNDRQRLYVINADGTNLVQLSATTVYQYDAHWSPDGTKLLFVRNESGYDRVYLMNPDGTGSVKLTNIGSQNRNPRWQPL